MEKKNDNYTWQQFLGRIIAVPSELQRIASELHVHQMTLVRWARDEARPRASNLRLLPKAIPRELAHEFTRLLADDFPEIASLQVPTVQAGNTKPPSEFYARILSACANTPSSLYPQALYDLILQQALEQIDPDRQGVAISIVHCVPPTGGKKVRSLREITGIGTPPWSRDLKQNFIFLGVESLAGAAVINGRHVVAQSRQEAPIQFSTHWTEHEQSAVAHPILRETQIAGCLLVASAQAHYFVPERLELIECYADLMALTFRPHEFYDHEMIDLRLMPHDLKQEAYFYQFRQRVLTKIQKAAIANELITLHTAQTQVWQEIEEELLQFPSYPQLDNVRER
ncbi:MAG TPA: hypothetical protein VHZ51_08880 [Ktedonobacteraceae bacterium]|jgi:hypothetical protein|nr:hypothetical protein [Ktedonobacteraceae bacterium]